MALLVPGFSPEGSGGLLDVTMFCIAGLLGAAGAVGVLLAAFAGIRSRRNASKE